MLSPGQKVVFFVFVGIFAVLLPCVESQERYWPVCSDPELGAPPQPIGGLWVPSQSDIVWNGRDFAVIWVDHTNNDLFFRRFFADGSPVGDIVTVSTLYSVSSLRPRIVWNDSGYGVSWTAVSPYRVHFARLNLTGQLIGSELLLTGATVNSTETDIAWSGSGYAVVWSDNRNSSTTGIDIFATLLDVDGAITNIDIPLCTAINDQVYPKIVYSPASDLYIVAWRDSRIANNEIWGGTLAQGGSFTPSLTAFANGSGIKAYQLSLSTTATSALLVWDEFSAADSNIFCKWISAEGQVMDPATAVQLTSESTKSYKPYAVSTGVEFGIVWTDTRRGGEDIWFQRVDTYGNPVGTNEQITFSLSQDDPAIAFGKYGYLFTSTVLGDANYIQPLVCTHDMTPPSCPGNLVAYAITGTSAIIAWGHSTDLETDLASYILYRNDWEVARTSNTLYVDTDLTDGVTYNYMVQPINAVQLQNTDCTESLYVKTSSSLKLEVTKDSTDALLTWTDENMNNYNVFRGTSPQVMKLIGNTSDLDYDDENILLDNVTYFYTVDNPGW